MIVGGVSFILLGAFDGEFTAYERMFLAAVGIIYVTLATFLVRLTLFADETTRPPNNSNEEN